MALTDIWKSSPAQLADKLVYQVIAFAGSGKLRDGGDASGEFRDFLAQVPSTYLIRYVDECLSKSFDDSGLALQDVVNEVGRRLGFVVDSGLYRGSSAKPGFDGIWQADDGKSIVVEVKTTDAYRIDLNAVAGYRQSLIQSGRLRSEDSSILIVVGRQDTGDVEAQIRGSRHAWDTRLISVDSLIRLMRLKEEELEEPVVVKKIRDILTPQEFTRVDGIIDIVFAAAEDVRQEVEEETDDAGEEAKRPKFVPAAFHDKCMRRIEKHLGRLLIRRSRATYLSTEGTLGVLCTVSRAHGSGAAPSYWYAFHPHQRDALLNLHESYVGFGCGSEEAILLIPLHEFTQWLDGMNVTERPDRFYWHVSIFVEGDRFILHRKKGFDRIDLTKYLLPVS
jgi:hypothetical protein